MNTATLGGMALGGWMPGAIFDITGSYRAAFLNGTAWNLLNVGIVLFLCRVRGPIAAYRASTAASRTATNSSMRTDLAMFIRSCAKSA